MAELKFTLKVRGIYVAPLGARELVLHRAKGWRLSIRDAGARGFGTDLRCVSAKLEAAQIEAQRFAASIAGLSV